MIFEFLISYNETANIAIVEIIRDCLGKVLEDNLSEFDDEAVERMLIPRHERVGDKGVDDDSNSYRHNLFGFSLDLPDDTDSLRIVVDEFAEALNTPPVAHLVKFEDPLLRADLARWAEEIFTLEMKLRRVLTLVYLHAYQDDDPYELLREETVQPMSREQPNPEHMKDRAENQFYHLTFGQYVGLNQRPAFKLADLLQLVRNKETYDTFREELSRAPVEDEDDAVLLAGLKERMDAIEAMRNCCAHSRRPSKKVEQNYNNARPLLDQLLDDYLGRWEWSEPIEEMLWDRAAREIVENAIENATWDEDERKITLFDADDDRIRETVRSKEEFLDYLTRIARDAFYANAPRDEGEYLYEFDDFGIRETTLGEHEASLDEFFDEEG